MAKESIDRLAHLLAETVPQGLRSARDDLEENFRAVLSAGIGKLDLVTREEFEVQQAVLARTREKLEALETRLATMESAPGGAAARIKPGKKAGKKPAGKSKTSKKKTSKKKTSKKKTP
jgi:hypothetical protein